MLSKTRLRKLAGLSESIQVRDETLQKIISAFDSSGVEVLSATKGPHGTWILDVYTEWSKKDHTVDVTKAVKYDGWFCAGGWSDTSEANEAKTEKAWNAINKKLETIPFKDSSGK